MSKFSIIFRNYTAEQEFPIYFLGFVKNLHKKINGNDEAPNIYFVQKRFNTTKEFKNCGNQIRRNNKTKILLLTVDYSKVIGRNYVKYNL